MAFDYKDAGTFGSESVRRRTGRSATRSICVISTSATSVASASKWVSARAPTTSAGIRTTGTAKDRTGSGDDEVRRGVSDLDHCLVARRELSFEFWTCGVSKAPDLAAFDIFLCSQGRLHVARKQ